MNRPMGAHPSRAPNKKLHKKAIRGSAHKHHSESAPFPFATTTGGCSLQIIIEAITTL
jgi:hypothetical protein